MKDWLNVYIKHETLCYLYIKYVIKRGSYGLPSSRVCVVIFTHSVFDTHDCNYALT